MAFLLNFDAFLQTMVSIDKQLYSFILSVRFFGLKSFYVLFWIKKILFFSHPTKKSGWNKSANFTLVTGQQCCHS